MKKKRSKKNKENKRIKEKKINKTTRRKASIFQLSNTFSKGKGITIKL